MIDKIELTVKITKDEVTISSVNEEPDFDVVAPEFDLTTESFNPTIIKDK